VEKEKPSKKVWTVLSVICFILGVLCWIPNLMFNLALSYWMLTFIINPIGIVFGVIGKSKFGIISNAIMSLSFFILMFAGYLINALSGGKP
jgi:hypothetical protein